MACRFFLCILENGDMIFGFIQKMYISKKIFPQVFQINFQIYLKIHFMSEVLFIPILAKRLNFRGSSVYHTHSPPRAPAISEDEQSNGCQFVDIAINNYHLFVLWKSIEIYTYSWSKIHCIAMILLYPTIKYHYKRHIIICSDCTVSVCDNGRDLMDSPQHAFIACRRLQQEQHSVCGGVKTITQLRPMGDVFLYK